MMLRPVSKRCIQCTHISKRRFSTSEFSVTVRSSLGKTTPYVKGWVWQHVLLEKRLQHLRQSNSHVNIQDNDWLLLFEHDSVYTLGRGASEEHLKFLTNEDNEALERLSKKYRGDNAARLQLRSKIQSSEENDDQQVQALIEGGIIQDTPVYAPNNAPIYRIERGGEVTYHGPGQLVLYPMLNLRRAPYQQDLHWYLRQIEEVIIRTLRQYGIESNRDEINTGVWVGSNKIAAVGVSSSRWITTHGCALNVKPNLEFFNKEIITPCGIEERDVTSLYDLMGDDCPSVQEVAGVVVQSFGDVFGVDMTEGNSMQT